MSETTKDILRNYKDDPCPQYYNPNTDAYEVQRGSSGASDVNVKSMSPLVAGTASIGTVVLDGTDATGVTQLTGGTGSKGWLSGAFKKLSDIATSLSGILQVKIDQTTDGTTNRTVSKISQTAGENVVVLGSGSSTVGTVKIDGTTNTVKLDTANNTVKIDATANAVSINHMDKGAITTAHNAIVATATSAEINCVGYNSLLIECAISAITSGNWIVDVQGAFVSGGTVGDCYDLNAATPTKLTTGTINANGNRIFLFRGIPDYVKIKATRTTDGTLTCKVQPVNM